MTQKEEQEANAFTMKFTDIPLGSWDMNGNWYPNLNLKMSSSEQRRHNMIGGHFDRVEPIELGVKFVVDDTKQSKTRKFLKHIFNCIICVN